MPNTVSPRVRLRVSAPAPTGGGGDALADWIARRTAADVLGWEDFSRFTSTTHLLAERGNHSGNVPLLNRTDIVLDRTGVALTGGQCLRLDVFDGSGVRPDGTGTDNGLPDGTNFDANVGWGGDDASFLNLEGNAGSYRLQPSTLHAGGRSPKYRPMYVQVVMRVNKAAIGWRSGSQAGNKIFYGKGNSAGQVYFSAGEAWGGWLQFNKHNGSVLEDLRNFPVSGIGNEKLIHNGIDNGTPTTLTTPQAIMLRYGMATDHMWTTVTGGNAYSKGAAVPYLMDRPGYPEASAYAAGSPLIVPNQDFVVTFCVDPAPVDVFPKDGSGPVSVSGVYGSGSNAVPYSYDAATLVAAGHGGRRGRLVFWFSQCGEAPRCVADSFSPFEDDGGYTSARTNEETFTSWRCQHYYTDGVIERGRPTQQYYYHQVVWGYSPIPHPGGYALPTPTYGPIVHYPEI